MPKETFYNLNEEKKLKIIAVLKKVLEKNLYLKQMLKKL